ncbi:MAG: hypothetical protein ABI442_07035 [Gemmatimonadaceae bacterium]
MKPPFLSKPSRAYRAAMFSCAIGGLAVSIAAVKPVRHLAPGLSFRISASTRVYPGNTPSGQDDEVMRGRGVAVNNHSRIEFLAYTPAPQGVTTDDFLIGSDSGKVFLVKATGTNNINPANDTFGGPAVIAMGRVLGGGGRGGAGGGAPRGGGGGGGARGGRGGGGGPPGGGGGARGGRGARGGLGQGFINQIQLLDVGFKIEKLGAGDAFEGRPTEKYRITSDYRVVWADQNFPAHAVTEIVTTKLSTLIPNPFEPLIVADQSTDGPLIEYALKLRAVRSQVEGTPIKVVTTTTFSDIRDILGLQQYTAGDPTINTLHVVQTTQITNISAADVDPKLVMVPDGSESPQQ